MENFFTAFQPNPNLVAKRNFKNNGNLLFNNIEYDVLNQDIFEIVIQIDSLDRDIKTYPNPFDMKITFNPTPDSYDKKSGTLFKGTPGPTVSKDFSYVKYVKLDSIVLPRNCYLTKKYDNESKDMDVIKKTKWDYHSTKKLNHERFLLMDIKEIVDETVFGTNTPINKSFGTIYCDKLISPDYFTGTTYGCTKIYKSSSLGNIKTWSIKIKDSIGNTIEPTGIDKYCDTPKFCICKYSKYTDKQKEKCVCKYVRHPLNPKFQVFMCFKVGILINELNMSHLKN